jgi:hypothetical protein
MDKKAILRDIFGGDSNENIVVIVNGKEIIQ